MLDLIVIELIHNSTEASVNKRKSVLTNTIVYSVYIVYISIHCILTLTVIVCKIANVFMKFLTILMKPWLI